jgi:hypothetical protein
MSKELKARNKIITININDCIAPPPRLKYAVVRDKSPKELLRLAKANPRV